MNEVDAKTVERDALYLATAKLITQSRGSGSVAAERVAFLAAADVYGDARELKGHVGACGKYQLIDGYAVGPPCGDKWYCDTAPIKESVS